MNGVCRGAQFADLNSLANGGQVAQTGQSTPEHLDRTRPVPSFDLQKSQTDLQILTNRRIPREFIDERINAYRLDIESYITRDERFLRSLKPLDVELGAPAIIKEMSRCSKMANVGPMASVAGAIAQFLGNDLLNEGCRDVIIENGGDIFLSSTRSRVIGIYSGRSKLWNNLKIKIPPRDTPVGICTSSGTIGHSLSFGSSDCAIILSKSAILADAIATATANRVNSKEDLQSALDFARSIKGINGALIIFRNNLISWGRITFTK